MASKQDLAHFMRSNGGGCRSCGTEQSISSVLESASAFVSQTVAESLGVISDVFRQADHSTDVGKLFRCRGMVQEIHNEIVMFSPSASNVFPALERSAHTGNDLVEAHLVYVIPIPGHTAVYRQCAAKDASAGTPTLPAATAMEGNGARKRPNREDDSPPQPHRAPYSPRTEVNSRTDDSVKVSKSVSDADYLNFPLAGRAEVGILKACVVTVLQLHNGQQQDGRGALGFKTNDVVDFYGYLHFPERQLGAEEENTDVDFEYFSAWRPTEMSPALVSRMVCLSYAPLGVCPSASGKLLSAAAVQGRLEALRDSAVAYIAKNVCKNDRLLAEYMLLHLCSSVCFHTESTPVGDVPLLVTGFSASSVSECLRDVVPVSEVLLDNALLAGDACYTPIFDADKNYLKAGLLQLANGTHVTVDCDSLTSGGTWEEALFSLVHKQILPMEYPFQRLELPVMVNFLAVTAAQTNDGLKSTFDFALHVPWRGCEPTAEEEAGTPALDADGVRAFLAAAKAAEVGYSDGDKDDNGRRAMALQQCIETNIVDFSRQHERWSNRDPFIHNNTFSVVNALIRAQAASNGHSVPTEADIARVFEMERERMSRF